MNPAAPSHILIVDDNEVNRDVLATYLHSVQLGYALAENGYQALALLGGEHFDMMLLDLVMPGLDGFEVMQIVRQRFSLAELPIIVVTSRDDDEAILKSLELGANDFITKPIDFPILIARMNVHLTLKHLTELKDSFLQMASHDLKNPLAILYSTATMMEQQLSIGDQITEHEMAYFGLVVRQIHRMQRIIGDFLDFQASREGRITLQLEPRSINSIIEDIVRDNADYAAQKNIRLNTDLSAELPTLAIDNVRLSQVIENLISNAIKFASEGDSVSVRSLLKENQVLVEVSDTGPGLTADDLEKAFSYYARLSNKPTGGEVSSGLGLAICRHLIELHQGKIGVHNNPQKGATFWFSLPLA